MKCAKFNLVTFEIKDADKKTAQSHFPGLTDGEFELMKQNKSKILNDFKNKVTKKPYQCMKESDCGTMEFGVTVDCLGYVDLTYGKFGDLESLYRGPG